MSHWQDLRRTARARRDAAVLEASGNPSATALLAAADRLTGFERLGLRAGDPLLDGGDAALDLDMERIWFNREVDPRLVLFYQAHEYAHLWLHGDHTDQVQHDLDPLAGEEPLPIGVNHVEGYGPEERREREANVFAREFLLPTDLLREWYETEGLGANDVAARLGLPEGLVLQQMALALLAPELGEQSSPVAAAGEQPLDRSQEIAAHTPRGPLLLEAGPGTGKTRTIVGRTVFLLRQNVPPSMILALTFSNRAAEEMRSRIAEAEPEAASRIWIGTFHAFGLEMLRKYGSQLGLPPRITVIDPTETIALLERMLPELGLDHYQNLYDPVLYLRDIASAISRAKDELVGPEEYTSLAEGMLRAATTPEETEQAERALEVARVYTSYQEALDREHLLDFGDLIFKPVTLLRMHPDVRNAVRSTYRHVLVDEYQDVNRASGLLLKEVAGAGAGLWVVGDTRQAIYRFRGASPANIRRFGDDFPGAVVKTLQCNYRSLPAIINVFAGLAPRMSATSGGPAFIPWEPHRSDGGGRVLMEIASDFSAEANGLAGEIERQRAAGISYGEQAVLCRSHTYLARIAAELERAGVPVLYLGDLFERPEVRDMLALVSLVSEPDGRGLVRVARFREYQVPLSDVLVLLDLSRDRRVPFPRALDLAQEIDAITAEGKEGLSRLARHLNGLRYVGPWILLARYLFERSEYLRPLLSDHSVAAGQRRLALHQLLQFAREHPRTTDGDSRDPKLALLRRIRRLEIYGDEKQLRQVPSWVGAMDAVRLLTVHASKGLEFRAVYLPTLGRGIFPARRQAQPCPPPTGMLPSDADYSDEEEECLFFVALSRARDVLCLSRARRYGARNSNASDLLVTNADLLPANPRGPATWLSSTPEPQQPAEPSPTNDIYSAADLDTYIRCPRQFYYESVLGLGRRREDSGYVQFHVCVYEVLRWVGGERASGRDPGESVALSRLGSIWSRHGPHDHPFEALYRASAETLVRRATSQSTSPRSSITRPQWEVRLRLGRVQITPDRVEARDDGSEVVERLRTGRPTTSERRKDIYALYQMAARDAEPQAQRTVQVRYLSTGQVEPVDLPTRTLETRLGHYDDAIAGILRADFTPRPNDRVCPRCPHYFICPVGEDA